MIIVSKRLLDIRRPELCQIHVTVIASSRLLRVGCYGRVKGLFFTPVPFLRSVTFSQLIYMPVIVYSDP